jgi:hypothetical protein
MYVGHLPHEGRPSQGMQPWQGFSKDRHSPQKSPHGEARLLFDTFFAVITPHNSLGLSHSTTTLLNI